MTEPQSKIGQAAVKVGRVNRRAKQSGLGLAELLLILLAVLAPLFLFASKISGDEWIKAAVAAGGGAVIYVYKLWQGRKESD